MKLIKRSKAHCSFEITGRENKWLLRLLKLYPLIPETYQKLSHGESRHDDQKLLEAALKEQRKENQRQISRVLRSKSRFKKHPSGYRFTLKHDQIEWLLQVLNDIRVGSWLALGSPESPTQMVAALNEKSAPTFWALEISGFFQVSILNALAAGSSI